MSQVQIENQKNLDEELQEEVQEEQEEDSSIYTSEVSITTVSEEVPVQKLSEMQNKNKFLTKVGFYFLVHSLFALSVIVFIKLNQREAKRLYRVFRLSETFKILIIISLCLKIVWGFLARFLKFLNILIFLADSIMLSFITLGLYFYLEEYKRIYYISNGFFMAIYALGFCLMSLAFTISTFFTHKKTSYNQWVGIILMLVASLITLKLVDEFWLSKPMQIYHFLIALLFMSLWTFYVPLNAYLIVNFRGDRLQSDEALVSYFEYGIDWFSFFWAQIFLNIKFVKKRLKKRRRNKKRKQKAKKKNQKKQSNVNNNVENQDIEQGRNDQNDKQKEQALKSVPNIDDDFMFEQTSKKSIKKSLDKQPEEKPQPEIQQQPQTQNQANKVQKNNVEFSGTNPTENIQQLF